MKTILKATCAKFGQAINSLAAEGKIKPVDMIMPGGTETKTFNSIWAATDFLSSHPEVDRTQVKYEL